MSGQRDTIQLFVSDVALCFLRELFLSLSDALPAGYLKPNVALCPRLC